MFLKTLLIRSGERLEIRAIAFPSSEPGGRDKCPVLAFFEEQAQARPKELMKLSALLIETARNGPPPNETKFKNLGGNDGLYEFKTPGGLRLFCFWDAGSLIVSTHGYVKGSQKAPQREIERAKKWMKEYFLAKRTGELINAKTKK